MHYCNSNLQIVHEALLNELLIKGLNIFNLYRVKNKERKLFVNIKKKEVVIFMTCHFASKINFSTHFEVYSSVNSCIYFIKKTKSVLSHVQDFKTFLIIEG